MSAGQRIQGPRGRETGAIVRSRDAAWGRNDEPEYYGKDQAVRTVYDIVPRLSTGWLERLAEALRVRLRVLGAQRSHQHETTPSAPHHGHGRQQWARWDEGSVWCGSLGSGEGGRHDARQERRVGVLVMGCAATRTRGSVIRAGETAQGACAQRWFGKTRCGEKLGARGHGLPHEDGGRARAAQRAEPAEQSLVGLVWAYAEECIFRRAGGRQRMGRAGAVHRLWRRSRQAWGGRAKRGQDEARTRPKRRPKRRRGE